MPYAYSVGIHNVIRLRMVMVSIFVFISVILAPLSLNAETDGDTCLEPKIDWRNYQWTLITGNGVEACEDMLSYLKSRPADQPPPTCPEDRLPPNKNWTRPESRILSQAEKQVILDGIPVDKPWVKKIYEPYLREAKILRVIKADITRDNIPEMLLAYPSYTNYDYRIACKRSTTCAEENRVFKDAYKYTITLMSDATSLLPMTSDGKQVDWNHPLVGSAPMLMLGELVFYKGLPYLLSSVQWIQAAHDDFKHSQMRPRDPYSAIFSLNELGHSVIGQFGGPVTPAEFKNVKHIIGDGDSCRFGFFNRENLRLNTTSERR